MDISWQVIGHDPVKRVLEQQLAASVFPHAYLFIGPEGVGKKTLAREFISRMLQIERIDAHTDVNMIDAAAKDFDIEAARKFMDRLTLTPLSGNKTVGLVDNADQLTVQASNAFLKTLEEPSPQTMLVLIAGSDNVLDTVKSRCQVFRFGSLTVAQLEQFAVTLPERPDQKLIELSGGSPGRLSYLAGNPEQAGQLSGIVERLDELMQQPLAQRFASIPELADAGDDLLETGLRAWLFRQRQALAKQPKRFVLLSAILESLRSLDQSMNRKLVLQRLFTSV